MIRTQPTPQAIPGTIYNSESGFLNSALAATNPNLATAGLADFATRLKATFQGVPAGAQLWVGLNNIGATSSLSAALTASEAVVSEQVGVPATSGVAVGAMFAHALWRAGLRTSKVGSFAAPEAIEYAGMPALHPGAA